jgi:hypothetical protein
MGTPRSFRHGGQTRIGLLVGGGAPAVLAEDRRPEFEYGPFRDLPSAFRCSASASAKVIGRLLNQ